MEEAIRGEKKGVGHVGSSDFGAQAAFSMETAGQDIPSGCFHPISS